MAKRGERAKPDPQPCEDAGIVRWIERASLGALELLGDPSAGAEGNTSGNAATEQDRLAAKRVNRPQLGELCEQMKILARSSARESARPRVGERRECEGAAEGVERVARSRTAQAEHVVAEKDLIAKSRPGNFGIARGQVAEVVDECRRASVQWDVATRGERPAEVVSRKHYIGVTAVDPGGLDAAGAPQNEGEVRADLAGQPDALILGQDEARVRPIDDEEIAARMSLPLHGGTEPRRSRAAPAQPGEGLLVCLADPIR